MDFESKFDPTRKEIKKIKKQLKKKDRSQYKKSNLDQKKTTFIPPILPKGRTIAILADGIEVFFEDKTYLCQLKGSLKKEKKQQKNLITVGDFVYFDKEKKLIEAIDPRASLLSRADHLRGRKEQLIASNIDQVLIVTTFQEPTIKPALIDRYLIAAKKGGMEPILVINKIDLATHSEEEEHIIHTYRSLNIPVLLVSVKTQEGLSKLLTIMQNKANVFSGQSGVGKTSLINLITGRDDPVHEIMRKTQKGSHTTTYSRLVPLDKGGFCIDTPGIKSFGIFSIEKKEIESFFEEIHKTGKECAFSPCSHIHEPNCAVKKACDEGEIAIFRYLSYLKLLEETKEHYE